MFLLLAHIVEAEGRNGTHDANVLPALVNDTAVEKKSGPMKTSMSVNKKPVWLSIGLFSNM